MTAEAMILLGGLALILFFVSIYVNERWHPTESAMSPAGRRLYRIWQRGLMSTGFLIGSLVALSFVGGIVVGVYERWLPHDVRQEIVVLQGSDADGVFVAADEKCASEYEDSSHAEGLEAKERLIRIRRSCGAIVENGEPALLLRKDREAYSVRILFRNGHRNGLF